MREQVTESLQGNLAGFSQGLLRKEEGVTVRNSSSTALSLYLFLLLVLAVQTSLWRRTRHTCVQIAVERRIGAIDSGYRKV